MNLLTQLQMIEDQLEELTSYRMGKADEQAAFGKVVTNTELKNIQLALNELNVRIYDELEK